MMAISTSPLQCIPHHNVNGLVHCLIEISLGSEFKYEYNEDLAVFEIRRKLPNYKNHFTIDSDGFRKSIPMSYPINYGCIPRTLADDGDCLDVMVLGPAIAQGSLIQGRIVGALEIVDMGKMDYKVLVIPHYHEQFEDFGFVGTPDFACGELPWGRASGLESFFAEYKNNQPIDSTYKVGGWVPSQIDCEKILADASVAFDSWEHRMQVYKKAF